MFECPRCGNREDILELAYYFLSRHGGRGRLAITPAWADALLTYDWPGNVRELERMIEGAIATCESQQIGSTTCRSRCAGPMARS